MKRYLILFASTIACGDDGGGTKPVDAPPATDGATTDAPVGACDYTEQQDLTNDNVIGTGTAEATGLSLATKLRICGELANTHFDDAESVVDIDGFTLEVPTERDVVIRFASANAAAIEYVGVDVYGGANFADFVGGNTYYGDHGAVELHLPAGTYEVAPFALALAAPAASAPYVLEIETDMPDTRCAALASGGYAEANDGQMSTGNDMITIPMGSPIALTANGMDAPEPTAITLDTTPTALAGSLASRAMPDYYHDRDAFLVTTGPTTNELAVRVDTQVATADLDVFLLEAEQVPPVFRAASMARPDRMTVGVKPNTAYWIVVGATVASTGLPATYRTTLCPTHYEP